MCSDHIPFHQKSAVIEGLENGVAYNFILVPYDLMGNPRALTEVVTATPDTSEPELVEYEGGCGCTASSKGQGGWAVFLGALVVLGLRRRR